MYSNHDVRDRCRTAVLAFMLLLLLPVARASADPIIIGSAFISSGLISETAPDTGRFILAVTPVASVQLFSEHVLSAADIGRTFVANAGNDDDFAEVARQFTNGVGNFLEWQFAISQGAAGTGFASEGALFGLATPDFRGFTISSLAFHLQSFAAGPSSPGFEILRMRDNCRCLGKATLPRRRYPNRQRLPCSRPDSQASSLVAGEGRERPSDRRVR